MLIKMDNTVYTKGAVKTEEKKPYEDLLKKLDQMGVCLTGATRRLMRFNPDSKLAAEGVELEDIAQYTSVRIIRDIMHAGYVVSANGSRADLEIEKIFAASRLGSSHVHIIDESELAGKVAENAFAYMFVKKDEIAKLANNRRTY